MPSQRMERVDKLLRSEISNIIVRRVKDPRVGMVTITNVDASPDLKNARVLISIYGSEEEQAEALEGLQSAAGFIRSELMKVLHLRPMPSLEFAIDEALEQGMHTLDLLDKIRHEHEENGGPLPDESGRPPEEQ